MFYGFRCARIGGLTFRIPPCRHVLILNYFSIGEGSSYELHHIPFAYKIDVTSQDYEEWEAYEFELCGQVSHAMIL